MNVYKFFKYVEIPKQILFKTVDAQGKLPKGDTAIR